MVRESQRIVYRCLDHPIDGCLDLLHATFLLYSIGSECGVGNAVYLSQRVRLKN